MYKITNIETLGHKYTVSDPDGNLIKTMQIISDKDILNSALGPYNEKFESIEQYLEKSIAVITGYEKNDPLKVLWYATEDEEVVITEIIEYAVNNGYDKIILEHLEELD